MSSCQTAGAQGIAPTATATQKAACCQSLTPPASSGAHSKASLQWQSCSSVLACQLYVPP